MTAVSMNAMSGDYPPPLIPPTGEILPKVAWPTVTLFLAAFGVWCVSMWAALTGSQPLWISVLANSVVSYLMFTVTHDASHHALGKSSWLNTLIGQISTSFVGFYISFPFFRYIHIEHHRNANEGPDLDPDAWCSNSPRWQLPFRLMALDVFYAIYWLRHVRQRPVKEVATTFLFFVISIVGIACVARAGYLDLFLLLVVLPQRLAQVFLAWAFDYLPHHDLKCTARQNEYKASRNRMGAEWLMTPLLLSQNYHQIHHLHPSIPFYRYLAVWRRNESAYLKNGSELTTIFGEPISSEQLLLTKESASEVPHHRIFHSLQVSQVDRPTSDSVSLSLDIPAHLKAVFAFLPGQHVTVKREINGQVVRRSYSIWVSANCGLLRIGIKRVPGGVFSNYAVAHIKVGDKLEVMPPSGQFYAEPTSGKSGRYGAIAAGSGITPILSIIATTLETEVESRFLLLFGNQNSSTIMFLKELEAMKTRFGERLDVLHFLDAPIAGDTFPAQSGVITEAVIEGILNDGSLGQISDWYLCGPSGLTAMASAVLTRRKELAPRVHQEIFINASEHSVPDTQSFESRAYPCAVRFVSGGTTSEFVMPPSRETVLDAALRIRSDLPYSCMGGACGTCRAKVTEGTVNIAQNHALSDAELSEGYILCCQSRPTSKTLSLNFDA